MFWDKKKKDDLLPDLPTSPFSARMPISKTMNSWEEPEEKAEIHNLPSFPDSPLQKGFSQTAIKDAVTTEDIKDEDEGLETPIPSLPPMKKESSYNIVEMEEWSPKSMPKPSREKSISSKEKKPIFIRLEKFQSARASLESIQSKINEMEALLSKIREVKVKEDQEISYWEREMETVKARINSVMSDIFDRTE